MIVTLLQTFKMLEIIYKNKISRFLFCNNKLFTFVK